MIKGTNIEQQLFDHVDNGDNSQLITRSGIVIEAVDDQSLQAEFKFIETEDCRLSVVLYAEKKKFVETLNIKTIDDIDTLTSGHLMEAYNEGVAEMACLVTLNYSYGLVFQKLGNEIVATNDSGCKHIIQPFQKLETHGQIMTYTKRYYKLLEASEN